MSDSGPSEETRAPDARPVVGRLAPSPTGLLHLGNAWAFLLAWLSARSKGGRVLLRMEDLDPQRSRPAFAAAIVDDLHWLGLDWDAGPEGGDAAPGLGPMVQSQRGHIYAGAMARLESAGLTYPCFCSRKELRQLASAPHAGEEGPVAPDPCRSLTAAERQRLFADGRHAALRLRSPDEAVCFSDMFQGPQAFSPEAFGGDFALRRSDGVVAYQLAVAVDDGLMDVTEVVRGRDLLPSTPRQLLVMRFLGLTPPTYAHIPLLLDSEGERLAKRHASLSLAALRAAGARPEAVVGYLGRLAGINPGGRPVRPRELVGRFSPAALPRGDLRVMEEDMARLMSPNDG
ncbi:MAG: tRNA glutamyl-Q(34) synthetase GluQRS [Desulfovibrio sp.]|uniref:tRNA glutamyl-Q(34) synthetase GluQRS n=1 Tax=Desulfovibrio sp. TaxID=885 RepID=UPI001A733809|nr:tRNA glutamyl-Q(34) synthetase GluQRS [Desulfovibrio sp.]MBD5417964.1 tRNA glutamyl-Q(34) synthetase GluQRS [Desulfovibrio sp.]